jgi:hypothetical protein
MQIIQVKNPYVATLPSFKAFIAKAFPTRKVEDFTFVLSRKDLIPLMAVDGNTFLGMAVIHLDDPVQVSDFYSIGGLKVTRALAQEVVATLKRLGYNSFRATNMTGRSDKAWARLYGVKSKTIGTIIHAEV